MRISDWSSDVCSSDLGAPALVAQAVDLLAARGTLALAAAYPDGQTFALEPASVMSRGRRIIGVVEGGIDPQRFIPELVAYYRSGQLPMEKLVRTYPFSEIEQIGRAQCRERVCRYV